jgi:RHS repeat-associated protein
MQALHTNPAKTANHFLGDIAKQELASVRNRTKYSYDENLNRLSRVFDDGFTVKTQTLSYISNSNRVSTRNGNAVVYDAAGNVELDGAGTKRYQYGVDNRLMSVTDDGTIIERYRYTGGGERIVRETIDEFGATTNRISEYFAKGQVLSEIKLPPNGAQVERDIVWLGGVPIAQFRNRFWANGSFRDEQLVFLHVDHLGAPRIGTGLSGNVIWRWDSDAFGKGGATSDPDGDGETVFVKLRLPGQIADSSSGKRFNYYRDYDQGLGRYLASDPIGLGGGLNSYAYVSGNPVNRVDPLGLTEQQIKDMLRLALRSQDLNVPGKIGVGPLIGKGSGITNPITRNITIDNYYLKTELNCSDIAALLEVIVHESIHRTRPRFDSILRPLNHDDIYQEAEERVDNSDFLQRELALRCECST